MRETKRDKTSLISRSFQSQLRKESRFLMHSRVSISSFIRGRPGESINNTLHALQGFTDAPSGEACVSVSTWRPAAPENSSGWKWRGRTSSSGNKVKPWAAWRINTASWSLCSLIEASGVKGDTGQVDTGQVVWMQGAITVDFTAEEWSQHSGLKMKALTSRRLS